MANKIPKYWYADNSFNPANDVLDKDQLRNIHGNVEAPGNEVDIKEANCDFNVYLDERFAKTTIGHSFGNDWSSDFVFGVNDNAPSITIVPDAFTPSMAWNVPANFPSFKQSELRYVYYFTLANNGKSVKGASGKTYKLSVANTVANTKIAKDEAAVVSLYTDNVKYEYKNTVLKAGNEEIARIEYLRKRTEFGEEASRDYEARLVISNESEAAKDLINLPEGKKSLSINDAESVAKFFKATFDVNLGVAVFNKECGAYMPLKDNTFNVELLKPVYVEPKGPAVFTDAVDNGTTISLFDLVEFYDWRSIGTASDYVFRTHRTTDLYKYYNVDLITVNPEEIKTDLSGEFKSLKEYSNGVEFQVLDGTMTRIDNGHVVPAGHTSKPKNDAYSYDFLRYKNNTATVVSFKVQIPVRIHHKWSQKDLVVWVEGTVNRTEGN